MAAPHCGPFPDYFDISSLLTEDQRVVQQSVRDFVQKQVEPVIVKAFRSENFPTEVIAQMGEIGILGANLEGYGLPGMDNIAYGLVMKELERCDSGLRSFASVQ